MNAERPFLDFGERLKRARETRKMSIAELADLVGCKRQTIILWERGKTEPGAVKLHRAAERLGVSTEWLVTGEGFGTGKAALMALQDEIQRKIKSLNAQGT